MNLLSASLFQCLLLLSPVAGKAQGDTVELAELPASYSVFIFAKKITAEEGRTETRTDTTCIAVNGKQWRYEVIDSKGKGFVATYDGNEVRASTGEMRKKITEQWETLAPTSDLPRMFEQIKGKQVTQKAPAVLEGLDCTYYKLEGEKPNELWVLSNKKLPLEVTAALGLNSVVTLRYTWVLYPNANLSVQPSDLTYFLHRAFSDRVNLKLNEPAKAEAPASQ